ncbi:hypothetical protein EJ08DRAFT_676258 [Tothia fuscella]|uniref:Transmembrane protein n=1 Tax=Tothia fuscella TaxID=1048955 RepID=A0A9P4NZ66_9PEZI|nr:hypothetical protein EJ08DRAFT_676258 [Tothia fuscella]
MDRILLYRFLLLWPTLAFALPEAISSLSSDTASPTPSSAFPSMSAQDGTGVSEGGVGSTVNGGAAAGADGADKGAFSMSKGAIVGMSIGIGIVIVSIATLWFFWYMAKKRQWDVRQSIRRASRRITGRKVEPKPSAGTKTNRRGTVYVKPAPGSKNQKPRDLESLREDPKVPTMGWLADEKERSRSRSREPEEQKVPSGSAGGWKSKLGFQK